LLPLERDAWRERSQMPVHVAVPLLAAQAEDIETLGREDPPDSLADAVDNRLQSKVLLEREVSRDLLAMFARRDEDVTAQPRILVQKRDRVGVFVDDVMSELRVAGQQLADEATVAKLVPDRFGVDSH
jgi:hypothetical protein